ncbi:MAG: hypothetical protein ABIM21_06030 [candidate division WOR-3 bacterium]
MSRLKVCKPLHPWQFWHACRKILGYEYLLKLFGYRNSVKIATWCMDPRIRESASPSPIEKLQVLLEDLVTLGYRELAIQAIKFLAKPLNLEIKDLNIETSKDPMQELLDLPSVLGQVTSLFQEALQDAELTYDEALELENAIDALIKEALEFKKSLQKELTKKEKEI